ncbi:acyl carrier protein [Mycobacterium marinum]|uniref:acyl carrier protein n=1 Tax=Mycobacterium marinum TaxID=1781 RepID=UPI002358BEDE|nr:acyl carrier protein [Mycobacterium marinum]MDC8973749.1 acyl carrier protein [Mycobacterium marinum]
MPEIVGLSDGVEAGLNDGGRVDCHASVARQSIEDLSCVGFVGATLGVGGLSAASAIGMVASATTMGAGLSNIDSGELDERQLADWLIGKVGLYLNMSPGSVDVDLPLPECGIDSAMSLSLCADLQREHGIEADATIVWDYPTIRAMAAHLISGEF